MKPVQLLDFLEKIEKFILLYMKSSRDSHTVPFARAFARVAQLVERLSYVFKNTHRHV